MLQLLLSSLLVSGVRRLWNNLIDTLWTCSALLARYGIPSAQERKFDILEGGGIASLGEKNRSMELCSTAWFMESNLSLACWVAAECDVLFLWLSPQVLDGWHIVRTHYLPLSNVVFAQWHVGLLFIPGMMHVSSPCAKVWRLLPGGVIGLMSCFVLTQQ